MLSHDRPRKRCYKRGLIQIADVEGKIYVDLLQSKISPDDKTRLSDKLKKEFARKFSENGVTVSFLQKDKDMESCYANLIEKMTCK